MPDVEQLRELVPGTREALIGLAVIACFLAAATAAERLLRATGALGRHLPDDVRARTHRWLPRLLGAAAVLGGLDGAGVLPVREAMSLLHQGLTFPLLDLAGGHLSALKVLVLLLVLAVARRVSLLVQDGVARALRHQEDADEGMIASLQRLVHYVVLVLGLAVGLQTVGFDLSALLAASAVLGVGIAFGLQTISENFVAGLILLFERSIRPGDLLQVDGRTVRVLTMGIRSTACASTEDETIIVPNAQLVSSTVINHSTPAPQVRARAVVGVAYESDVDQVLEVLEAAARTVEGAAPDRPPVVMLLDFADSSIVFEVSLWAQDAWVRPKLLSDLRVAIWRALDRQGITIAFPQLDVHVDASLAALMRER